MTPQERALEIVVQLKTARLTYASVVVALADCERLHKLQIARAEARVIELAGDEKNLGSNQAARDRALLIGIQADEGYQMGLAALLGAETAKAEAWAEMEALRDELKVLLAFAREGNDQAGE